MSDFRGRHVEGEIVLWAARWHCRYGVSHRDLEQMMGGRGVSVGRGTTCRWVQRHAPEVERRLRWQWRQPRLTGWRVDETYTKVRGKRACLYRAVDKTGDTVDFHLSPTRGAAAARRFLGRALRGLRHWEPPRVADADKAPTHAAALAELKKEGQRPEGTVHRQAKHLSNVIEADRGKLKQLIRPARGLKTLKAAHAAIRGLEAVRAPRKGQAGALNTTRDVCGAARIAERAFGLGARAPSEAVRFVSGRLEPEAA